jgi:farnesyl-diphosphate farnesyltransferase
MAYYCRKTSVPGAASTDPPVTSLESYDLYCHYVAGLVGEGLSALMASSGQEAPVIGKLKTLSNSMGLMLQKVNIMRDFREDVNDARIWWPKEIWGKYASEPMELVRMAERGGTDRQKAIYCLNEVISSLILYPGSRQIICVYRYALTPQLTR